MAKKILTTAQENQFNEWVEDGNVAKIDDNTYLEQTTQWTKKFTIDELKEFFKREYLSDNDNTEKPTQKTFKDKSYDITYTVRKSPTRSDRWELVSSSPNWQSDDIELYVSEEDALQIAKLRAGIDKEEDPEGLFMKNVDRFSGGGKSSSIQNLVITATGVSKQNKEDLINMGVQLNFQGVGYYLYVQGSDKNKVLDYLRKTDIDFSIQYKTGGSVYNDLIIQRRDLLNDLINNGVIDEEHYFYNDVNYAISSNNEEQMREVIEELILSDIIDDGDWNYKLAKKLSKAKKFDEGGNINLEDRITIIAYDRSSPNLRATYFVDKIKNDATFVPQKEHGYRIIRHTGSVLMPFGVDFTEDWQKWFFNNTDQFERVYKAGGSIEAQNYAMAQSDNKAIMHHSKELNEVLKTKRVIPAWALTLINQSSQNLSNVTHYLDGANKFAKGGVSKKVYGDNVTFIDAVGNEQVGMVQDMDDKGVEVFYEERFMRVPIHRIVKFH